jgi:serine/threonine protein kinase
MYRAPEVQLQGPEQYDFSIDMWAFGCILAELLMKMKQQSDSTKYCPLFEGDYISGLSDENDGILFCEEQLNTIFNILGAPTREDLDSIRPNQKLQRYLDTLGKKDPVALETLFEHLPKDHPGIDLLSHCLVIDPQKRYTVEQALNHPYLATYKHVLGHEIIDFPLLPISAAEHKLFAAYDQSEKDLEALRTQGESPSLNKKIIAKLLNDAIEIFHGKPINTDRINPASIGYSLFSAKYPFNKWIVEPDCIHPASRHMPRQP